LALQKYLVEDIHVRYIAVAIGVAAGIDGWDIVVVDWGQ